MSLHDDVQRTVAAFPSGYVQRQFLAMLKAKPDATDASLSPAHHVTASAVVVHPDKSRVLLCLHRRLGIWLPPGGHCEIDDATLTDTAVREVNEESGLYDLATGPAIAIDFHRITCRYGESMHYDVTYKMALRGADDDVEVSDESLAVGWFAMGSFPPLTHARVPKLAALALEWAATESVSWIKWNAR